MKRLISLVLVVFFVLGNSHAAINMHYCGGTIKSISFITKAKSCESCPKTAKATCCKDVFKLLKADDFHKTLSTSIESNFSDILTPFFTYRLSVFAFIPNVSIRFSDIFYQYKSPIFIRICSLII